MNNTQLPVQMVPFIAPQTNQINNRVLAPTLHMIINGVKTPVDVPFKQGDLIIADGTEISNVDMIVVNGNNNVITTSHSSISGDNNTIIGNNNTCIGNNNKILGTNNSRIGNNNIFYDSFQPGTGESQPAPIIRAASLHYVIQLQESRLTNERFRTQAAELQLSLAQSVNSAYKQLQLENQQLRQTMQLEQQQHQQMQQQHQQLRQQDQQQILLMTQRREEERRQERHDRQNLQSQIDFLKRMQIKEPIKIDLTTQVTEADICHDEEAHIDADTSTVCVICMERKRKCLMRPCRHFSLCISCVTSQKHEKCPVCRAAVTGIERVFV